MTTVRRLSVVRPRLWPRSIRGKLVLALLVAVAPIVAAHVCSQMLAMRHGCPCDRQALIAALSLDAASVAIGVLIVFVVGNRLAHPIRRLALAANAISVGDYRKRVKVSTADELQTLAEAINALARNVAKHEASIRRQGEMLAGMAEAARMASSSLHLEECGRMVAKVMCTHLGAKDASVFRRADGDVDIKPIGRCGRRARSAWKLVARRVAESGDQLMISERAPGRTDSGAGDEGILVGIPLLTGGAAIGAIVARFEGTKRGDLEPGSVRGDLLGTFGIHAAAAISNADAYSQSEQHSVELEEWVDHLSVVMQVTDSISPSLTLDQTLQALAKATAAALSADLCCIFRPNREGLLTVAADSSGENDRTAPGPFRATESEAGLAFAERRTVVCRDLRRSKLARSRRRGEEEGLRSLVSTPLIVGDTAIGAIAVFSRRPRQFMPREIRLLTSISLHTAVIVRNADLYTREFSISEKLQGSLVSVLPDECRGLKLASRYAPALDEARVGGDFYEVVPLPGGRVGVVIGDVSGKGLNAAIHLAACKYMLRPLIFGSPDDPARVLARLNEAVNYYFEGSLFVTVFYGVIDPVTGLMRYANAGHMPGLLISEGGKMHTWLQATGMPVGSGVADDYETLTVRAKPTDLLLLYTDGVTDAEYGASTLGIEGLGKLVFEAGSGPASHLVARIGDLLTGDPSKRQRDDVALLAVSFDGVTAGLADDEVEECLGSDCVPAHSV